MTEDQQRQIDRMLESEQPPTEPIGDTNYEQVAVAWGKKHRLSLAEFVDRLEGTGARLARRLAEKIQQSPRNRRVYDIALHSPLHG